MTEHVDIIEVGPRDGLQNEPLPIGPARRVELIDLLTQSGLPEVEIGSFVSPKWVPQMADTARVLEDIRRDRPARLRVLVPNMKGWDAYLAACKNLPGPHPGIAVFVSASEGFSQANLNCSVAESLDRIAPVVGAARAAGVDVRGYISCVTDCPFDGPTPPAAVARVAESLLAMAPMQLSLGDTIGAGRPDTVARLLDALFNLAPPTQFAGHFHDTGGRALENIEVSLRMGLRVFDASVGGLGGCPYAPGAPGNVATEAVIDRVEALGFTTGVDRAIIDMAARLARTLRGQALV